MLALCLADSRTPYFWYALESIHKFIIELYILQCLFVKESSKKQRRGTIISHVTKEILFHLLWQPSALRGNLIMWLPFLHPLKKVFLSLSVWPKREYRSWTINWKHSLLIYFENWQMFLTRFFLRNTSLRNMGSKCRNLKKRLRNIAGWHQQT